MKTEDVYYTWGWYLAKISRHAYIVSWWAVFAQDMLCCIHTYRVYGVETLYTYIQGIRGRDPVYIHTGYTGSRPCIHAYRVYGVETLYTYIQGIRGRDPVYIHVFFLKHLMRGCRSKVCMMTCLGKWTQMVNQFIYVCIHVHMWVCVRARVCVCVCVLYIYMYIYIYIYTHTYSIYVCMCVVYIHFTCIYIYMSVCACACMYMRVCGCIHMCVGVGV